MVGIFLTGIGLGLRGPVGRTQFSVAAAAFLIGVNVIVAGVTAGRR